MGTPISSATCQPAASSAATANVAPRGITAAPSIAGPPRTLAAASRGCWSSDPAPRDRYDRCRAPAPARARRGCGAVVGCARRASSLRAAWLNLPTVPRPSVATNAASWTLAPSVSAGLAPPHLEPLTTSPGHSWGVAGLGWSSVVATGVATVVLCGPPVTLRSAYHGLGFAAGDWPRAEAAAPKPPAPPMHPGPDKPQTINVLDALITALVRIGV